MSEAPCGEDSAVQFERVSPVNMTRLYETEPFLRAATLLTIVFGTLFMWDDTRKGARVYLTGSKRSLAAELYF